MNGDFVFLPFEITKALLYFRLLSIINENIRDLS